MSLTSARATKKGWMPGATQVAIPASNFSVGCTARKAVVLHIVEGSAKSALDEFSAEGKQLSAHFVVSKLGDIWQCVSVLDTAYANGLSYTNGRWIDPEKNHVTPSWKGLAPPTNPNWQTISIEREGHYQDFPPAAQDAAVVRILQYVHAQFPTLIPAWVFMQTLIGHCHVSPVARANCPGPHVAYALLAAAANVPPTPHTVTAGPFGAIAQQSREPGAMAAKYYAPGVAIETDDLTAGYFHTLDEAGFIPSGQVEA